MCSVRMPTATADASNIDVDVADADVDGDESTSSMRTSALTMLGITNEEVKEFQEFASKTGQFVSQGFSSFLSSVFQVNIPTTTQAKTAVCTTITTITVDGNNCSNIN